ncbi:hypothetical protein LPJ73_002586 [Coemansia sp. RSA 2703]|nr:hypothetical protein LPJ73_002586 [Coemansia sp. RSA 2703]
MTSTNFDNKQRYSLPPAYNTDPSTQQPQYTNVYYENRAPGPQNNHLFSTSAPTYYTNAPNGYAPPPAVPPHTFQPQKGYIYAQGPYPQAYGQPPVIIQHIEGNKYKRLVKENPKEVGVFAALGACLVCCLCA